MPKPGEHKTVQTHILEYAEEIGWAIVPREEAEVRRGFDPDAAPRDQAKGVSLFFDDLLDAKVREFNPLYTEAEGALIAFSIPEQNLDDAVDFAANLLYRGL